MAQVRVIEGHTDAIYSLSFNADGSKFVTTCKDKKLRVFNAHDGVLLNVCTRTRTCSAVLAAGRGAGEGVGCLGKPSREAEHWPSFFGCRRLRAMRAPRRRGRCG
jgi:WD40 repeat protein